MRLLNIITFLNTSYSISKNSSKYAIKTEMLISANSISFHKHVIIPGIPYLLSLLSFPHPLHFFPKHFPVSLIIRAKLHLKPILRPSLFVSNHYFHSNPFFSVASNAPSDFWFSHCLETCFFCNTALLTLSFHHLPTFLIPCITTLQLFCTL